jgi:hypothetical protein
MDQELRLLDLIRKDWWFLVIVLCVVWAVECQLEGNSVIETVVAPGKRGAPAIARLRMSGRRWRDKESPAEERGSQI